MTFGFLHIALLWFHIADWRVRKAEGDSFTVALSPFFLADSAHFYHVSILKAHT